MSSSIRVAISGGGIAGASLLHALLQYPHIDAHIFESAPKFKEAGVAFGLTRNASAALDLIGQSATECLERAGGVQMKGVRFYLAQGKGAGDLLYETDNEVQGKQTTTIVQRANFLHELLAEIPERRMHASKRLETVNRQDNGALTLRFADGTAHECDILVGADGIHSQVRKIILGEHDPAAYPVNTGWWAIMTLQPYDKARKSIGEAPIDIDDAREISWVGNNTFYLHNLVSHGNIAQFSVCSKDAKPTDAWQKTLSADEIEKTFVHDDMPPHLNQAVRELLCDQPERQVIYFWEHLPASTYVKGHIAVLGDAAHATTPWQGAGGGMCIESSMIMSSLLGRASSVKEAVTALQVYDRVRRPRTQRLVESSHLTGEILTGQNKESGLDSEKLNKILAPRWDFIMDFDVVKHRDEALQMLETETSKLRAVY